MTSEDFSKLFLRTKMLFASTHILFTISFVGTKSFQLGNALLHLKALLSNGDILETDNRWRVFSCHLLSSVPRHLYFYFKKKLKKIFPEFKIIYFFPKVSTSKLRDEHVILKVSSMRFLWFWSDVSRNGRCFSRVNCMTARSTSLHLSKATH